MLTKIKRFISNKNTVTIICIVLGVLVLYFGYSWRVNDKINPTTVPYAKVAMSSRHVITAEDIGYIEVNSDVIKKATNLVKNSKDLIGKEVTYGNNISLNSLIYQGDVTDPSLSPDYVLSDIADGYTAFSLTVTSQSTYGNSILKGSYIDLWFSGTDDDKKIIYTNLVKSIKVLDVRDGKGVSMDNSVSGTPAELLFSVPDEMYSLLVKAQAVGSLEAVPRNKNYSANPGDTSVASDFVKEYILSKCATLPEDTDTSSSSTTSTDNNTTESTTTNSDTTDITDDADSPD